MPAAYIDSDKPAHIIITSNSRGPCYERQVTYYVYYYLFLYL